MIEWKINIQKEILNNLSKTSSSKSMRISREFTCAIAAVSLAVLTILAVWSFELRSFLKLIGWGLALSVMFSAFLYLLFFRKFPSRIEFDFGLGACALAASLLFVMLVFLPAPSDPRELAAAGIVFWAFFSFCVFLIYPINSFIRTGLLGKVFIFSALIFGFFGLGIILFNGLSVRMYGDDFCYAHQRLSGGWIGASLNFYRIWSARFFSNFLLMGLSDKHWAPIAQIMAILASLFLALKRLLDRSHKTAWPSVLAAAFFIPFTVFSATPDLYKSIFWIVSSVTVLPLLVFVPLYFFGLGSVIQSNSGKPVAIAFGALTSFAITTTHEVAALGWFFCMVFMLALFYVRKIEWQRTKVFLTAGVLAAGIGLAVLLASPGIVARSFTQGYPPPPPLFEILVISFHNFMDFIRNLTVPYYAYQEGRQPVWIFAVSLAGLGWFAPVAWRRQWRAALIILVTAATMAYLSFIPGAYATSGSIPLRSQLIPVAYLAIGFYCAALFIPRFTDNRRSTIFIGFAIACMLLGSYKSISQFSRTIQPMRQYAQDWDERHTAAQNNPRTITRISIPWEESEQEFVCVRNYYLTLFPESD